MNERYPDYLIIWRNTLCNLTHAINFNSCFTCCIHFEITRIITSNKFDYVLMHRNPSISVHSYCLSRNKKKSDFCFLCFLEMMTDISGSMHLIGHANGIINLLGLNASGVVLCQITYLFNKNRFLVIWIIIRWVGSVFVDNHFIWWTKVPTFSLFPVISQWDASHLVPNLVNTVDVC